jgi:hypothetical protein
LAKSEATNLLSMSAAAKAFNQFNFVNSSSLSHLLDSAGSGTDGNLDRKVGQLDVLDRHGVSVELAIVDQESEQKRKQRKGMFVVTG